MNVIQLMIKIIDTGRGIDPDIYPKLFSNFSTKSEHGTGLGLYLCKNLIAAHGEVYEVKIISKVKVLHSVLAYHCTSTTVPSPKIL